jgi:hypothetical protein
VLQMATYKYVSFVVIGIPHFPHSWQQYHYGFH